MNFVDKEHEQFYNEKLKLLSQYGKTDIYYQSLIYTLGICPTTRDNFDKIFNIKDGEIQIDSINGPFQTGTSEKVTRMAFSLWNRCMYDSEKDLENNKMSSGYNPSEIFSCTYAPFFYEGLKIRYPEYTKEVENNLSNKSSNECIKKEEIER